MRKIHAEPMKTQPLENVARFIRGITFTPEDKVTPGTEGSTVCMRTANVQDVLDESDLIAVPLEFVKRDEQFLMESDILVSTANSWNLVGKCSWVPKLNFRATAGGFISILRADKSKVFPRYLYYWFASDKTQHDVRLCGRQTTNISNMSFARCLALEIPLPPLSEQTRIADILDKADSIRRKRQEARTNSDALIASSFREQFGDPVTNSMGLETIPLSDYGIVTTGNTPSRKDQDNYGDAIEWIKSDNINTPSHWLTKSTEGLSEKGRAIARTVPAGSTLVTCIAGSPACVGNAAMTDRTVAFNQQINAVTPRHEVDPYFLYSLILLSQPLVQRASTASMKGMVSKGKFEQVEVIKGNEREQKAFGRVFQQILQLVNQTDQASASSNDLFESLVQRAFKGEL
jgi:type I restriction enzyme S subunit